MLRRNLICGAARFILGGHMVGRALADVPKPYGFDMMPPIDGREAFIDWAVKNRGEDPKYLGARFDRFKGLVANRDVWDKRNMRAFLMTPREEFVLKQNLGHAYEHAFLDIGFGVTISGPYLVARMTSSIDVQMDDKVRSALARAINRPISQTSPTRSGRSRSSNRSPSGHAGFMTR